MLYPLLMGMLKRMKGMSGQISGTMVIALAAVIVLIAFIVLYLALEGKFTNLSWNFGFT